MSRVKLPAKHTQTIFPSSFLSSDRRKFRKSNFRQYGEMKSREEKSRREKQKIQKKNGKTKNTGARNVRKVAQHNVFPMVCGSWGSKLHAAVARSTFTNQHANAWMTYHSPFSHLSQTVVGVKHGNSACHPFGKLDSLIMHPIGDTAPYVPILWEVAEASLPFLLHTVIWHHYKVQYGPESISSPFFLHLQRKIGSEGFITFRCSNATLHFDAAIGLVIGSALCCIVFT